MTRAGRNQFHWSDPPLAIQKLFSCCILILDINNKLLICIEHEDENINDGRKPEEGDLNSTIRRRFGKEVDSASTRKEGVSTQREEPTYAEKISTINLFYAQQAFRQT